MKTVRVIWGAICMVLGLSLAALLGLVGSGLNRGTGAPALVSLMPGVAVGLTVFAAGAWMVYSGIRKR
ncbi:hypothetical protein [Lysobacter sp. CA199]|uniref:hypothetical protein n=1 Tax=Lysobacter sp. CA199 TaxID=3455608 RepID=UPI003F8D635C